MARASSRAISGGGVSPAASRASRAPLAAPASRDASASCSLPPWGKGPAEWQRRAQLRQQAQGRPQPRQLPRPHLPQRHARGDPLHIAHATQRLAQRRESLFYQCTDRLMPCPRRAPFALRMVQPLPQRTRAHAGLAHVEQGQQGRRVLAAQGLREFEVAVRGRRQLQQVAGALDAEPAHVRECTALRVFGIAQQRGGSGMRHRQILRIEAGQAGDAQLLAQLAHAERRVELPGRPLGERRARGHERGRQRGRRRIATHQHLGRRQPGQPAREFTLAAFGQTQPPAGHTEPREAEARPLLRHREQQGVGALGQQLAVGHGAGRHHAHHLALDRPFGRGHVAHLLGNRHRLALLDELAEIAVDRMHRHARHHHRLAGRVAARGERDVEQAMRAARVVEKQLVEIAHPVEQQGVRMLGLDAQVLLHHRRVSA